jgi:hypothetical protein
MASAPGRGLTRGWDGETSGMRDRTILLVLALIVAASVAAIGPRRGHVVAQDETLTAAIVEDACDNPGPVAHELRDLVVAEGGALTSFNRVDLPIDRLAGGGYAVLVSRDGDAVACGDGTGAGDDVFIALTSRGTDGYGGIAWLHADGDQTRVSLFVGKNLGGAGEDGGGSEPPGPPEPPDDPTPTEEIETPEEPSPTPQRAEDPTATSVASGGDCTGVEDWLAATRPRVERLEEIGDESQDLAGMNAFGLLPIWEGWAEELSLFAQQQSATETPPPAQQMNADLTEIFQTEAYLLLDLIEAINDSNANEVLRVNREFQEVNATYALVRNRIRDLATDCGLRL